jgi:exopolyphosphatase/guanosine-5'-triphosphate,3'-diphosphate pyrophosphatase
VAGLNDVIVAALDLGTNSFHMVVARAREAGFEVIAREKETVRIGRGSGEMKELDAAAIDRGIASLTRMRAIADSHEAPITAVATSAVREARNRDEFIRRAKKEAGIDVRVVSGVEEARLIHLGALHGLGEHEATMFLCDIGGGSTEIVVGNDDEEMLARSFKIGAVRLTDRFFATSTLHPSAVASCRSFVRAAFMNIQAETAELGFELAVASSGTAETVARMIHARSGEAEPKTFNRYTFRATDVTTIVQLLADHTTVEARQEAFGLERSRAEIILAGAIILEAIADVFGIGEFVFSDYALREGLLIDTLRKHGTGPAADTSTDAAMRSVRVLADRCDDRPDHSEHVARIACDLFDQLHEPLGVDISARRLLEAAALLANVGVVVSHSKHHLHSYYVIRNSELVGLTDREIELIAQIARYHRKGLPKSEHAEFAALSADDQHIVRALAGVLRIAIGLDRTQDGRVKKLETTLLSDALEITFKTTKSQDTDLNAYAANERRTLLSDVLGRRVKVSAR